MKQGSQNLNQSLFNGMFERLLNLGHVFLVNTKYDYQKNINNVITYQEKNHQINIKKFDVLQENFS